MIEQDKDALPRAMSEKAAAEMLGVCPMTLWRYRRDGKIAFRRIGRRVVYMPQDIEAFLAKCLVEAAN